MATKKTAVKKKKFKVMQMQVVIDEQGATAGRRKHPIAVAKREYVPVATGLSWTDAQEMRRKDNTLTIVPEARVYKKRASRAKKS